MCVGEGGEEDEGCCAGEEVHGGVFDEVWPFFAVVAVVVAVVWIVWVVWVAWVIRIVLVRRS